MMRLERFALLGALTLAACGVASVSPVVTDSDATYDARLIGSWQTTDGRERAIISAAPEGSYAIAYADNEAKAGRFHARLGRIGAYEILDLTPDDPAPDASDVYRSLVLRTHGIVIVDSIAGTLQTRMLHSDSLKAYLARTPNALAHAIVDSAVLITAPSSDTRRFLGDYLRRPGVLDDATSWRRGPSRP